MGNKFRQNIFLIKQYNSNQIGVVAGSLSDVETMFTAKEMFNGLGVYNLDCRFNGSNFKIEIGLIGSLIVN